MKQKSEGKDLQNLVELGREQGYLTFDQVDDFLPQGVSSPTDLRSALESFEDIDIKILADVSAGGTDGELEAEVKEEPDEAAPAADSFSESSDPVRLYLKEMGNFQLLSREQEVEIAKRIEAARNEVEGDFFGDFLDTYSQVSVVHFTALGKPWFYSLGETRRLRPNAHRIFYELWETWRKTREELRL